MADPTLPSEKELRWLENYARLEHSRGYATISVTIEQALSFIAAARAVRRVEALRDALVAYVNAEHSIAEQSLARRVLEHVEAALTGAKP